MLVFIKMNKFKQMKQHVSLLVFLCSSVLLIAQNSEVKPLELSFSRFLNVRDFTLSTDGKEAYCTLQSIDEQYALIVRCNNKNGHWEIGEALNFSKKYRNIEPFLSPDNLRLYFSSNRPRSVEDSISSDYDIWYVERVSKNAVWSAPINVGSPVNTAANEFYPSISENNNLYYTSDTARETQKDDIYFSAWNGTNYTQPKALGKGVNSEKYEFNAFIAPNESFLIYTIYKAEDGLGSGDLYVSYKEKNGQFGKGKNLGAQLNSDKMDYCPFYDVKNEVLYFTSKRNELQITEIKDVADFEAQINAYANGLSRLYQLHLKL